MKIGSRTPWGRADTVTEKASGIWIVGTPGHGGVKLDRARNAQVHPEWRRAGGWYEEDCEWGIVALTFPEVFGEETTYQAACSVKNWFPQQFMKVTGTPVALDESRTLRRKKFEEDTEDEWVVVSASSSSAANVPEGMIGCVARQEITKEEIEVLVSKEEYDKRGEFGYVLKGDEPRWRDPWKSPK